MQATKPKEEVAVEQEEAQAKKTVLVVEDFDDTRFAIKLEMELSGYRALEATNGQEAVEVAQREHPDVILMDLGLPVIDGFKATRLIREKKDLRNVPIVAVSANATVEYRVKALAAGCIEYVTKPVDFEHLKRLVSRFAQLRDEETSSQAHRVH